MKGESESKRIAEALQENMEIGKRYTIADLINLLPKTDYVFSEISRTPVDSESNRPRWNRWVRNAVRNSPGREDRGTNGWHDLNAENIGPGRTDWEYWIEINGSDSDGLSKRPEQNDGWEAEQHVFHYLESKGYRVRDVSREGRGFDLLAESEDKSFQIEVKSSTSKLNLELTENEWQKSREYGDTYWIAILEDFKPGEEKIPKFVRNPSKYVPNERVTRTYTFNRSDWDQ